MSYKIAQPFKASKLVSYFRGDEHKVYMTEEYMIIGGEQFLFRVSQKFIEQYSKNFSLYTPLQYAHEYEVREGKITERGCVSLKGFWGKFIDINYSHIIAPTNYFYQVAEQLLVRKFTDGEHVVWINKMVIEIMGVLAEDLVGLVPNYQFDLLYNPSEKQRMYPVRVSFRQNVSSEWEPIALLSPFRMREEERQICVLCKEKLPF